MDVILSTKVTGNEIGDTQPVLCTAVSVANSERIGKLHGASTAGGEEAAANATTTSQVLVLGCTLPAKVSVRDSRSAESSISSNSTASSELKEEEEEEMTDRPISAFRKNSSASSLTESPHESSRPTVILGGPLRSELVDRPRGPNAGHTSDLSEITCDLPPLKKRVCRFYETTALNPLKKPRVELSSSPSETGKCDQKDTAPVLLSQPSDSTVLTPLHVFIRQQIEVFTATEEDMGQPAPGRKNPILPNQVGLRCIHCRHLPFRDRVKRAVCYPSSVGRVYHSVSDMKFDHFNNCKGLPPDVRSKLQELKELHKDRKKGKCVKKSSCSSKQGFASTAQYYHDSARRMGMVDSKGGVFFSSETGNDKNLPDKGQSSSEASQATERQSLTLPQQESIPVIRDRSPTELLTFTHSQIPFPLVLEADLYRESLMQSIFISSLTSHNASNSSSHELLPRPPVAPPVSNESPTVFTLRELSDSKSIRLASPSDQDNLNSIHCFVRRNIEVFAANEEDVNAPAPGRRQRVVLGQVGIRCVHCAALPLRRRVKRSICYPPTVDGIYHAVSNMKFDHFGLCRSLPPEAHAEFSRLRESHTRRGCTANNIDSSAASSCPKKRKGISNSTTAKYYYESALKMGLIDTEDGIRFASTVAATGSLNDGSSRSDEEKASDGIEALMIAATDPNVRAVYGKQGG